MPEVKSINWRYILVAYSSLFFLGLLDNARGPFFASITEDLNLTDSRAALLFATTSGVSFIGGTVVPVLARRITLVWTMRLGLLLLSVGFIALAYVRDIAELIVGAAIFGVGVGLVTVGQNLMVIVGATEQARRQLLSGLHSMYGVASLLAPLLAALVFHSGGNWRFAYFWFGVSVFISIAISFSAKATPLKPVEPVKVKKTIHPHFFILGLILSLYVLGELTLSTRLPLYLRRVNEFSDEWASLYLSLFFVFLMIGRLLFTFIPMRRIVNVNIISAGLLLSLFLFILGILVHPAFFCLSGFAMAPLYGVMISYFSEVFPSESESITTFTIAMSALFIVSMHLFLGFVTERYGIDIALWFGPVCLALSWMMLMLMIRKGKANILESKVNGSSV